ncbi:hypothetical protein [Pedobacter steynii]|uniref:Uncharacterized protein n=1 Tax=Pedobacter steynii TaxID=430522 RepID=A0A1D7QQV1_9SPHI|nr:hypothetical protein [Pedobacter steynii]AOM80975.1 hypothetical protein BFS30_23440 [Pedobacter steynii]
MRNTILKIYILISILLLANMSLYFFYKISLRGYYSDVILFWFWFFGSITIVVIFWKKVLAKLLLAMIVLSLILSILPMAIPFFAFIFSTTPFGLWLDKNLNQRYRAQIVGYSVMAHPVLQVIEKRGVFEKQVFQCDDSQLLNDNPDVKIRQAKDIIFNHETDTTLSLTLFYGGPNKKLTFSKASGNIIEEN